DFSLYLVDENVNTLGNFPLLGKSFKQALVWLEEQIIRQKLSSAQLKLDLSYDFPFSVSEMSSPILEVSLAETEALGVYYEDVEFLLSKLTAPIGHFSEILVQPSTMEMYRDLILKETGERETDTMLTFGLSPGDSEYPLPYLFVKTRPHIMKMDRLLPLSQGHWHTGDWTGAVLPCSKLWGQQSQQQLANSFMEESLERLASRLLE
ncbi:MAG: hypothetical protein OEY56_06385, partial [Cyclobacteriaceae bacterium]|nr:hypothetical protein [Cyclobacteriaceae bacterium]